MHLLFDVKPAVLMSCILIVAKHACLCLDEFFSRVVEDAHCVVILWRDRNSGAVHCLQTGVEDCDHEILCLLIFGNWAIRVRGVEPETPFPVS